MDAVDAFGIVINTGDTIIVARTFGRSCTLAAGIVTRIDDKRLYYEVVMDKGYTEKLTDYGPSRHVGDICYVLPKKDVNEKKYDKIINVGYGFDHDDHGNVIGELFVR